MGIVVGPDIDLRIFFTDWKYTFAVNDNGRQSIQFFDRAGLAIHKVFCIEESDLAGYRALVEKFTDHDPRWPQTEPVEPAVWQDTVDQPAELREHWLGMKDTHQFFEIGRASCRERVCQYVMISVVAVPLKKK